MEFVYVLTNKWLPGLSKLGQTKDLSKRLRQITSVLPGKTILRWSAETENSFEVESRARGVLSDHRVSRSRDWYHLNWRFVASVLERVIKKNDVKVANVPISTAARRITSTVDIGSLCRDKRRMMGITQAELADIAGVGIRFVSEFERGKETCEIEKCLRVCSVLGINTIAQNR